MAKDIAASQQKSIDPIVPTRDCQVEIALLNGRRLIVPTRVDPEALARLLSVVDDQ
ncbi:hypothetical protein [Pseudoruegeria sp. SK021]|uniref:hypothetical protein n=1 Tax=Pseudoruegeria sp. SK021 TaxID=1933035 RepID=UPI001F0AB921|nr:hypothetical protein [Pseudoruegeria sp. SK021]